MIEKSFKKLMNTLPQQGKVEWIGLRPASKVPLNVVDAVVADTDSGLIGDRFAGKFSQKRQVTLIQSEHIETVKSILKNPNISPELMRRNIVVSGINLLALKEHKFKIGDAILEWTGLCQPCSRMEENLGEGGYNAMRGHGGITARVIESGEIKVGDAVYLEDAASSFSDED